MPGTNAGTGHRVSPRCFWCAKKSDGNRNYLHKNDGYTLLITGRRRKKVLKRAVFDGDESFRENSRVDPFFVYEVECADCRKIGWTRHATISKRWHIRQTVSRVKK